MSFDFSTLITDRTASDVTAVNDKGTYNASDLNRVTGAMEYLHDLLTSYGYDTGYIPAAIHRPDIIKKISQTVEKDVTTDVTGDNVASFFTVADENYYFSPSGGVWTSNNGGVNSSTAKTEFTALADMTVSFSYSYSSEANYDKFTLIVAGTTVESAVSGATTAKSYSGSLTAGQTISLQYTKDSSSHSNDDKCTMSNLKVTWKQSVTEIIEIPVPDERDPYIWFEDDIPTWSQLEQYRRNVAYLRGVLETLPTTPEAPADMDLLTWTEANDIEQILKDLESQLSVMITTCIPCGDALCGGDNL